MSNAKLVVGDRVRRVAYVHGTGWGEFRAAHPDATELVVTRVSPKGCWVDINGWSEGARDPSPFLADHFERVPARSESVSPVMAMPYGVAATAGHLADNGGIRGHSAGATFPFVLYSQGTFDALTYWVLQPNGLRIGGFESWEQAEKLALQLKESGQVPRA